MSSLAEQFESWRSQGSGLVNLSTRTLLLFTGPDRTRYLNGQLTANLLKAKPGTVLPACVATAKGKLCADVFVSIGSEGIAIDAAAELADALAARLEKYIVADDVYLATSEIKAPHWHLVGSVPERFPEEWRPLLTPINRIGVAGFDLLPAEITPDPTLLAGKWLARRLPVLSVELIDLIRIEHGLPAWGAELDESTFPSEAGLDRTHVDFHKGCYIGQEIISRLKSVGQANRELRGFTSLAVLTPGARIFATEDPSRDLGRITSAVHSLSLDRPVALGYLRRGATESGLFAAPPEAPDAPVPISLHPLPFVS